MLSQHIGLGTRLPCTLKRAYPTMELEELVQIGMVGLLEAAKSFDASQGADLGTCQQADQGRTR